MELGPRQLWLWNRGVGFFSNFQCSFKRKLNLFSGFSAGIAMRHNARPFGDLGNEALVTRRG